MQKKEDLENMQGTEKLDVSIIIVNYKQYTLTLDVINSIIKMSKGFSYEIIIVDNSNNQNEFEKLKIACAKITNVKLIDAKGNLGFGRANNLGSNYSSGKYILFLNNDTLLMNNAFLILKQYLDSNSNVGIVGPNIYTKDNKPNASMLKVTKDLNYEKKSNRLSSFLLRRILNKSEYFNYSDIPLKVNGCVNGACLMIRSKLFLDLGGFDKDIFMFGEENLLCYRVLHETNYLIYNVPSAKIIHFEGSSFNGLSEFKAKAFVDGTYIYYKKVFGDKIAEKYIKYMIKTNKHKYRLTLFFNRDKKNYYSLLIQSFNNKLSLIRKAQNEN